MRTGTLNIRGLRNRKKRLTTFKTLRKQGYDVVLLQETYVDKSDIGQWTREWHGQLFAEPVTKLKMGNVILIRKGLEVENLNYTVWSKRIQMISFILDEQQFCICNCYAPSSDNEKLEFFSFLKKKIDALDLENVCTIICGDMNVVYDVKQDNIAGKNHREDVVKSFRECFTANTFNDAWRKKHPAERRFTWKRNNPLIARRIDYIFTI